MAILKAKILPNKLSTEAVYTVVYILNRPPAKAVMNKTPFEAWHKRKPEVSSFRCIAYAHTLLQEREKSDDKEEKYLFISYSDECRGYRLLNPRTDEDLISRDVVFD